MRKEAMAGRFTEVTLDDMERFLKRGFRALRPKQGSQNNEYYYDLSLSPNVIVRVWTSIQRGSSVGADVGADAIRVQLMSRAGRPLTKGKAPIVKRTPNWRTNLQERVEDAMEMYDDKEEYWESRAGGPAPSPSPSVEPPQAEPSRSEPAPDSGGSPMPPSGDGPTDKQVNYVMYLLKGVNWYGQMLDRRLKMPHPPTEDEVRAMSRKQVSFLIGVLKGHGSRRYNSEEFDYDRTEV